mgnify:FL=1
MALQNVDMLRAMAADAETPLTELKVDGGAARNNLLMQLQADLLGADCVRPTVLETTALGAAFLAGLGAGLFPDTSAITEAWVQDRRFSPTMDDAEVGRRLAVWARAVARA